MLLEHLKEFNELTFELADIAIDLFSSVKKIQNELDVIAITYKDVLKAFKNYKIYSNEKDVRTLNISFGIILEEVINYVYKNQDKFKKHKKFEYFMKNGIKYKFLIISEYEYLEKKSKELGEDDEQISKNVWI